VGGYDHQLFRIDTSDGRVRLRIRFRERLGPLPEGYGRGPAGVAVGPDGVWVSHGVELTRFDPQTGAVERTVRAGGPWVSQVAVGEGLVWVAFDGALTRSGSLRSAPALDAVSPDGARQGRVPLAGLASDIEVGDGYVWVAITRDDAVWRIDPTTLTVAATVPSGDSPVSVGLDEGVWVSNSADATVTRLDPTTGEKLDVVPVGHTLEGLAAADGEVWVAVRAP
jgi:YVTN family beta-propeller protein